MINNVRTITHIVSYDITSLRSQVEAGQTIKYEADGKFLVFFFPICLWIQINLAQVRQPTQFSQSDDEREDNFREAGRKSNKLL